MKSKININELAVSLAESDDSIQSELINSFAKELRITCKDMELSGAQPCAIARKLDANGIVLVKALYEFIKLREEANS